MIKKLTILISLILFGLLSLFPQATARYGLIDIDGGVILPFRYDTIYPEYFDKYINIVSRDGRFGLASMGGQELCPLEYQEITQDPVLLENDCFEDPDNLLISPTESITPPNELRKAKKAGKWGLLHQSGQLYVKCKYDSIVFHRGNSYRVKTGDKWGLVDKFDNTLIKPLFDQMEYFGEHLMVKSKGRWGVMDTVGKGLAPLIFDSIVYKKNRSDLFIAYNQGRAALLALQGGKVIIPPEYEKLEIAHNILIAVKDGKYGLVDIDNKKIVPCEYTKIEKTRAKEPNSITSEYFTIWLGNKCGIIDSDGRVSLPIDYDDIEEHKLYNSSFAITKNGKVGMSYRQRHIDIPIEYEAIHYAKSQQAIVENKGMQGVINYMNKEILPVKYDSISVVQDFPIRYYRVILNGKVGLANEEGKFVLPLHYEAIRGDTHMDRTVLFVNRKGRWGALDNEDLSPILPYEYDEIVSQTEYDFTNCYVVKKKDRYGFINGYGTEIIPCTYREMKENTDIVPPVFVVK